MQIQDTHKTKIFDASGQCEGVWEGPLVDAKRHGRGTMHYVNGSVLEVEFVADVAAGPCKFTFANKTDTYEGEWANGNRNGFGVLKTVKKSGERETFAGHFKNGLKHGPGTLTKADGSVKKGDWVDGERKKSLAGERVE